MQIRRLKHVPKQGFDMGIPAAKHSIKALVFDPTTVKMLPFGIVFYPWVVLWTYVYIGNSLEVPSIVSGWRKHARRPSIVVFVDPLDDYGATSEVRATCAALGLRVVNMWSPQVARKLLSYLEQMGEEDADGNASPGN